MGRYCQSKAYVSRFVFCATLLSPLSNTQLRAQDQSAQIDPEQPFQIAASSEVDENLFALRLLGNIYSQWPDLKQDRSKLKSWFESTRTTTAAMRGQIHTRRLDPDLEIVFSDCLDYMSATESYLSSLQLIEDQQSTQSLWDFASSLWDGYQTSDNATSNAKKIGMSPENAANAGNLVGAADAAAKLYQKSQARTEASNLAIAEQARKLEDRWASVDGSLKTVSRKMTAKYGWAVGEAGFDGFQSPQIADQLNRSPRDPFLREKYGDALLANAKNGNDAVPAINSYLRAASLVPADAIYDSLRAQYVEDAMEASVEGTAMDAGGSYSRHPASVANALKLSRTYLAVNPNDSTGVGHAQLARALAYAGRYQEAVYSAQSALHIDPTWEQDPRFCVNAARLMSLLNDANESAGWIEKAYRAGYSDVSYLRQEADFAGLRARAPQRFEALVTPKWSWKVRFFSLGDAVVLQNDSPFDLTNVKLNMEVRQGSRVWTNSVSRKVIKAGSSVQFDSVFNIPDNHLDYADASLTSDQGS